MEEDKVCISKEEYDSLLASKDIINRIARLYSQKFLDSDHLAFYTKIKLMKHNLLYEGGNDNEDNI